MFLQPELREGAYYNVGRNTDKIIAPGEKKPKGNLLFVKSLSDKDITYQFVDSASGEASGDPIKESKGRWGEVAEEFQLSLNTKYLKSALMIIASRLQKE